MIQKIRVQIIKGPDLRGEGLKHDITSHLHTKNIDNITTIKIYRLEGITEKEATFLAEKLFCEKINQTYSLNAPLKNINYSSTKPAGRMEKFSTSSNSKSTVVEIAYQPGVMNPEVTTILKATNDLGVFPKAVDTSWEYAFYGSIDKKAVEEVVTKVRLYNPLIEHIVKEEPETLVIHGKIGPTITIPLREMTNEKLLELSKDTLFLNLEELHVIQKYFQKIKRDPTDCELETLAQTWSEHCAHKTFKAKLTVDGKPKDPLITRIKKEALKHDKNIVSAFVDNSGVMDFYDEFAICGKAETHNSPSAIEPYGGAMTGSGGVFRDVVATGLGAKAIASTDIFCFAPPNMDLKKLPQGSLPPEYLLKRCVAAVRDYGNRIGIPTNNGSFHFHDDFRAKPTVLVGSYGIIPKKDAQKGQAKVGDMVIAIGGRTGRDGIHGATFSSGEMTERTITVNSAAVQIGNAIEEKRIFDAIIEARDKNIIRAVQDCGAGGFSSAIGEMGEDTGVTVDLSKAKVKYPGLSPWEIWISESQERMILAIPQNKLKEFLSICKKNNVEESILGHFDGTKKLTVFYGKKRVAELSMEFLHHGLPQRTMVAKKPLNIYSSNEVRSSGNNSSRSARTIPIPKNEKEWIRILEKVLSHGNINSKEPIVRMYDHSVQGTNDLQPYSGEKLDGPNNAAVLRPLLNKPYGVIISHGLNPVLNRIDPYHGSIWAAIEALSNYVAVGGNYKEASLINNYIWPFPDEESLWSLDKSVDAVVDIMAAFKIPVISGKDSLSSTYRGKGGTIIKIPPVLCISVFGKIPDTSKTITSDFKKPGSVIALVGKQDSNAMGGSVYAEVYSSNEVRSSNDNSSRSARTINFDIPHIDLTTTAKIFDVMHKGITSGKILSAHDISEGGLITTLFEMCIGGDMGANVILSTFDKLSVNSAKNLRSDFFLFNETAGTFLVEVENETIAKKIFANVPYAIIGNTTHEKKINVEKLFSADIEKLKKVWQEPMKQYFP